MSTKSPDPLEFIYLCIEKMLTIRAILYNWKTGIGMEAWFSINNMAKRAEDTPGWQHALNYHRFLDVRQFLSVVPIF